MDNDTKKGFSKWLEMLQQESWQLELIISGFAIFLLLGAYEPILELRHQIDRLKFEDGNYQVLEMPYGLLLGAWYILVTNLIIHVLLRGLWISTIGLRYVSGDIDFEKLNFHPKFDQFLKKRIVSFDVYISQLEKLCSIIFAFTFLLIFILISGGMSFAVLILLGLTIDSVDENYGDTAVIPFAILIITYLIGLVFYALDFITLGWLKKSKWFAKIYYPFYRFYSITTLAFIYRPLYYNLIDNKFGQWVGFLVIPYLITFAAISSLAIRSHSFLPAKRSEQTLSTSVYEDSSPSGKNLSSRASIPSKYIKNGFIELFLPYNPRTDDRVIQMLCPNLKRGKTGIGFKGFFFDSGDPERYKMNADSALTCNTQRNQIYVNDSLMSEVKFKFYTHPVRDLVGLFSIIDINHLDRGEHTLHIKTQFYRYRNRKDTLIYYPSANIPFWKE